MQFNIFLKYFLFIEPKENCNLHHQIINNENIHENLFN